VIVTSVDRIDTSIEPNFFIIGAAKSGTTTLYHLLKQHPDIYLTADKEPRFFDADNYYRLGVEAYLRKHFRGSAAYPVRGEATPFYLTHGSKVASRIQQAFGHDLAFIVIMRDPVARAWSHYLNMVRLDSERETFEKALALESMRLQEAELAWIGYFYDGLYARHLEYWFKIFPREKFLLLLTEDLQVNPEGVARQVFEFLGVDSEVKTEMGASKNRAASPKYRWLGTLLNRPNRITNGLKMAFPYVLRKQVRDWINEWNARPYEQAPQLDPAIEEVLRQRYPADVQQLEEIMGRDLSHWLPRRKKTS
jgi:hypothetical protein